MMDILLLILWIMKALFSLAILLFVGTFISFILTVHPPEISKGQTPQDFKMPFQEVSFKTKDKIKIKGWLVTSKKAKSTIIFGHGYPFNKSDLLHIGKFLYPKYNLLFFDYRYFGESEGKASSLGINEPKDVKAAIKFIQKKFPKKQIGLFAVSMGAGSMLMSHLEKYKDIKVLVFDSSYSSMEEMSNDLFKWTGPLKYIIGPYFAFFMRIFFGKDINEISPKESIKKIKQPILIIHGGSDLQIPTKHAYRLKESNPNIKLTIFKNAGHCESHSKNKKKYEKKVKAFFKRYLK